MTFITIYLLGLILIPAIFFIFNWNYKWSTKDTYEEDAPNCFIVLIIWPLSLTVYIIIINGYLIYKGIHKYLIPNK